MTFRKGQSGNPTGRRPIVLPAIRREGQQNKNDLKAFINRILKMNEADMQATVANTDLPLVYRSIAKAFLSRLADGGIPKLLTEIATGPLVDDPDAISDEERAVLAYWRERMNELPEPSPTPALPADGHNEGGGSSS